MTKEELRKEATTTVEWECTPMIERPIFINGYITGAEPREKRITELEAQIDAMKYCGNCENGELSAHEEPCLHCQRCFASKDVKDQENVKDNWEEINE